MNPSPSGHHLGYGDTFPFTATDPTDELVTDESRFGVRDVEHPQKEIPNFDTEFLFGDAW